MSVRARPSRLKRRSAVASLAAQRLADVRMPFGQTRPLSLFLRHRRRERRAEINRRQRSAYTGSHAREEPQARLPDGSRSMARFARRMGCASTRKSRPTGSSTGCRARPSFRLSAARRPSRCAPCSRRRSPPLKPSQGIGRRCPALSGSSAPEGGQLTGGFGFGPEHRLKTAAMPFDVVGRRGPSPLQGGRRRYRSARTAARLAPHDTARRGGGVPRRSLSCATKAYCRASLLASPASLAGKRKWREPPASLDAPMRRYIAAIMTALECPALAANEAGNELTPRALDFSPKPRPHGLPSMIVSRRRWRPTARSKTFATSEARPPKTRPGLRAC